LQWTNEHFSPASYYYYERNILDIEKYILSLPIFNGQPCKKTWKDVFGISFNDWNRCHFLASDVGSIALNNPDTVTFVYTQEGTYYVNAVTEQPLINTYVTFISKMNKEEL
jgi:hypothetical protein